MKEHEGALGYDKSFSFRMMPDKKTNSKPPINKIKTYIKLIKIQSTTLICVKTENKKEHHPLKADDD